MGIKQSIADQDITDMHNYRVTEATTSYTYLFSDNEENYRKALIQRYAYLREDLQYPLIVQNEAQKVYALAEDGYQKAGIKENSGVWTAYSRTAVADRASQCAIARVPMLTDLRGSNNCCAITASAIQAEVSAQMGYDDEDNLIQKISPSSHNKSLSSALYVCSSSTADEQYVHKGNGRTLNQLIAAGEIKTGDEVSLRRGATTKDSSGCHAVTVTDVQYNDKGEPVSYTLHSNNGRHYETISVTDKGNWAGGLPVEEYLSSHDYWHDKIQQETKELANLSTKELEERVTETENRTVSIIDDLQKTEIYASAQGYNSKISDTYMTELAQYDAWNNRKKEKLTTEEILAITTPGGEIQQIFDEKTKKLLQDPIKIRTQSTHDTETAMTTRDDTKQELLAQEKCAKFEQHRKVQEYAQTESKTNNPKTEKKEKTYTIVTQDFDRA